MKKGWEQRPFESCIEPVEYTRKVQRKDFLLEGQFPIVSQEAEFTNGFWDDEADLFKLSKPVVIFGDHTQVLKYVDFDFILGADGVKILQPRSFLWPKFFFYQLQSAELPSLGYARHYRLLKELVISVPPLVEQQRIVGVLDKAFAGLSTAQANAEKNCGNARSLFESHLQSVFTHRGQGWVDKTIEEVCRKITDGTHHSPKEQYPTPAKDRFLYITSKNIRNNYMDLSEVAYIDRKLHEEIFARCAPSVGDVLLTKDGASTGNVTLNTITEPFSLLSSVALIKTKTEMLMPSFLCYYLQSTVGLQSIVGQMTGAAIKRIVLKDIKKAVVSFPGVKEQQAIVTTLGALLNETQRLTRLYEEKQAALAALKKSLLHQAFTGAL